MSKLFDDASLAMIPSAYKDGKLYSIRPTDGSGDFTFSRGSNLAATRVDVNGLIEKGRENLFTYSNNFSHSDWTPKAGTFTQGETDPNGGSTAWSWTALNADPYLYQNKSLSGVHCISLWAKGVGNTIGHNLEIRLGGNITYFTLTSEWQRFEAFAVVGTSNKGFEFGNPTATSGDVIHIYGAQLEQGLVATDYIETGTSAAQSGILEDMPRLDYSASCPSLLLEPQRRNIITDSEYLEGTGWGVVSATESLEDVTTPDGGSKAYKVTANNNSGGRIQYNLGTFGNDLIYSAFFKGTGDATLLRIRNNQESANEVQYNIDEEGNFTFNSEDALDDVYGIESYSNGWNRIYFKTDTSSSASNYLQIRVDHQDGDGSVYIWGAQVEDNGSGGDVSYPTSYIPTYGTSQTRSADFSNNNDILGTAYSSNNFSYFIEFKLLQNSEISNSPMLFGGGSAGLGASGQCYLRIGLLGNNTLRLYGHGDTLMAEVVYAFTKDTNYKLLVKRSGTDVSFFVNGVQIGSTQTSSLDFTLRSVGWSYNAGTYNTYGDVKQFVGFETALTDSECIALTTL